ncbi:MAG: MBL fold metallo-hydrolase [Gammaproteobacteria bacterium]
MRLVSSLVHSIVLLGLFVSSSSLVSADSKLAVQKVKGPLSVMVLGSGGPIAASAGRASSGYLIFVEGKPRIVMDMGGGTFKSLAKSGTNVANLEHFLLTHLHLDHTADMSAIVKTVFFHNRARGLQRTAKFKFYGPATNGVDFPLGLTGGESIDQYPGSVEYVDSHYDIKTGMERYLNVFAIAIEAGKFNREATDLPSDFKSNVETSVFEDPDGLKVTSIAVNHGPVPAVAYKVEYQGHSIVWSGDTTSKTGNMIKIATGADILIYDTALMADAPPPTSIFHKLHTLPSRIAEVALAANPRKLVLSHLTPITDSRINEVKTIVRNGGYTGKIKVAKDLKVYNIE